MQRLPHGRHGLPPEFVAESQRERLIGAIAEVLYEDGYPRASVTAISKRAAVSKRAFYRQFPDREACFAAAFDHAHLELRGRVEDACAGAESWTLGVRAALAELVALLSENPPRARLLLVESQRAGHAMFDRYQNAVEAFAPLLARGAPRPEAIHSLGIVDRATVGGVATLLSGHLLARDPDPTLLLAQLTEFVLTPYLGSTEARRIAAAESAE